MCVSSLLIIQKQLPTESVNKVGSTGKSTNLAMSSDLDVVVKLDMPCESEKHLVVWLPRALAALTLVLTSSEAAAAGEHALFVLSFLHYSIFRDRI